MDKPYNIKIRCYEFSKRVVLFMNDIQINRIQYSLPDQLLRSATLIGANIIEAKSGSSKKDFIRFYTIVLKSANETKYWLCLIRDTMSTINKETVIELLNEANEISRIIARSIISLKQNPVLKCKKKD